MLASELNVLPISSGHGSMAQYLAPRTDDPEVAGSIIIITALVVIALGKQFTYIFLKSHVGKMDSR